MLICMSKKKDPVFTESFFLTYRFVKLLQH
jgi:hypothetical protein